MLTTGSVIGLMGIALSALIYLNWDACVKAAKLAGAAQAVTAAAGVIVIGAALVYAGSGRKNGPVVS